MGASSSSEPASVEEAKANLEKVLSNNTLVLLTAPVGPFGAFSCPFCKKVIKALDAAGIPYHHEVVGQKGSNSRSALIELCKGTTSVPEAFCFGKWIGGYDESDGKDVREAWMGISGLIASGKLAKAVSDKDFECLTR
mmetsp:Transcript_11548/g.30881  ORF Transcript_11548/g.30881 Transcript_11548/m.30881 type:complete len:138 (+) Transcript_11548:88-501(+)|eukprot:CAMPEP_0117500154 /NCGR_PEP_ID=MMETSP0784-20121206/22627_1 /TAXON_ID=39447 /ORGANISM="" /LENGTH=137 /DNA_ID=CAMNT_0005295349 /DNA_START=88 /DNA_END=501 /DNA_ORIENTATION=-